jgi:hypothetical protein
MAKFDSRKGGASNQVRRAVQAPASEPISGDVYDRVHFPLINQVYPYLIRRFLAEAFGEENQSATFAAGVYFSIRGNIYSAHVDSGTLPGSEERELLDPLRIVQLAREYGHRLGVFLHVRFQGEHICPATRSSLPEPVRAAAIEWERERDSIHKTDERPLQLNLIPFSDAIVAANAAFVVSAPAEMAPQLGCPKPESSRCLQSLDPAKLSDVIATALDKLLLGELTVVFALLPANWQPEQMGDSKLDTRTVRALETAPAQSLAEALSLHRLSEVATERLTAELASCEGQLPQSLEVKLMRIEQALAQLHHPIREMLLSVLNDINSIPHERRKLGSLEENQALTRMLQRLLSTVGERLCCPSCDSPGTFRCKPGNSPDGVFEFVHGPNESRLGKRGCGGWSRIPTLKLQAK